MGCSQSSTFENTNNQRNNNKNNADENEKDRKIDKKGNNNSGNEDNKEEKELSENKKQKKKSGEIVINTEENKELSNIITEGVASEIRKMNLQKQNYEGVVLMKGVEESIPEDLNEEDVYQLVENALYDKLVDDKDKTEGKLTKKQAKAIASILYNKIRKEDGKKDNKKTDLINIDNYPELKGMKIKIGVGKLTREIIKNVMFQNKEVDECQIDLTYANLTRENSDVKALTIELE